MREKRERTRMGRKRKKREIRRPQTHSKRD